MIISPFLLEFDLQKQKPRISLFRAKKKRENEFQLKTEESHPCITNLIPCTDLFLAIHFNNAGELHEAVAVKAGGDAEVMTVS